VRRHSRTDCDTRIEPALAQHELAERPPFDERHDVEEQPVRLAGIEQGPDVRVVEAGRDADLAQKAFGAGPR
jgi:hypothetical protein